MQLEKEDEKLEIKNEKKKMKISSHLKNSQGSPKLRWNIFKLKTLKLKYFSLFFSLTLELENSHSDLKGKILFRNLKNYN